LQQQIYCSCSGCTVQLHDAGTFQWGEHEAIG
jgi:hypothetical protein